MRNLSTLVSLVFFTFFCIINTQGQEENGSDSTAKKDSVTISGLAKSLEEIKKILQKAESDPNREDVGVLHLSTKPVSLYASNGVVTATTVVIDRACMVFQDGYIVEILVYSGDRIFTNTQAPVTLSSYRFSKIGPVDFLINRKNPQESILLQDALDYEAFSGFACEDERRCITKENPVDTLKKNVGVNTVLDLRIYTDVLAALGDEANGIFQADAKFKQTIHRRHVWNSGGIFLQYFKINVGFSKLDSKNNAVDATAFSRSELIQKSKISPEFLLNIFSRWVPRKSLNRIYVDGGIGINQVNFANGTDTSTITVQNVLVEGGFNLKTSSNIGCDITARTIAQFSPQTEVLNEKKTAWFLRLGGEVYWSPFQSPASRIFGRINYVLGMHSSEKDNQFFQVQFGYSTLLSELIGRGKS